MGVSRRSGPTQPEHLRRRQVVACRLTRDQISDLAAQASAAGVSQAAFIEHAVLNALGREPSEPMPRPRRADPLSGANPMISLRVPVALYERLRLAAERDGIPRTEVARRAMAAYFDGREPPLSPEPSEEVVTEAS